MDLPSWVDKDAFEAFEEMRKRLEKVKKVPWTEGAKKGAIRDLGKLYAQGEDPTEVLWQSVTRGWAGLFEVKNKAHKPTPKEWLQEAPEPPVSPERKAEVARLLKEARERITRH